MENEHDVHEQQPPEWQGSPAQAGHGGSHRRPVALGNRDPRFWLQIAVIAALLIAIPYFIYEECRIDVPNMHLAILTHKIGDDLAPGVIIAPSEAFKGVQKAVLAEGRYYYNPYAWDWQVVPQVEVPEGKLGVRIRMYGDDLPAGKLIAAGENQKGIVAEVLRPGRYPYNAVVVEKTGKNPTDTPARSDATRQNYAEIVELHEPVTIPAGYKGLLTDLTADMPKEPNQLVSERGERGVQNETLEPGTYYLNPYMQEVRLIDCRSQRYNLTDIGFPTKDGFWVSLEAIIEFRVKPDTETSTSRFGAESETDVVSPKLGAKPKSAAAGYKPRAAMPRGAARTYILYDEERAGKNLAEEVIAKVILPNARAYTRLRGSNHSGKEFITGQTRVTFQEDFQRAMKATCDDQGIEIIQALITSIKPPEKIADPVRRRQIALQQEAQYKKEIEQQLAEQELAVQRATVLQKKAVVEASQEVVVVTTEARKKQEVALIDAAKRLAVAEQQLMAAKDLAAAIMAKGKAAADVVRFANQAEAAGWQKSIAAFSGDGNEFARWTLYKKLAPAYQSMMINTDTSPLMDVFKTFEKKPKAAGK